MDTQFCHASVVMDVLVSNRVPIGSSVDCLCVNELKTTAAFINRLQKKKKNRKSVTFSAPIGVTNVTLRPTHSRCYDHCRSIPQLVTPKTSISMRLVNPPLSSSIWVCCTMLVIAHHTNGKQVSDGDGEHGEHTH